MSKPRRLIITDANGSQLLANNYGEPLHHYQIDLTGIANANATMPMNATVQEQCNLGCWHDRDCLPLSPWGPE